MKINGQVLRSRDVHPGMRLKRKEGEGDQLPDVGRVGTVLTPTGYNNIAGTIVVSYDATETLPEKIDDSCSPFEFELV